MFSSFFWSVEYRRKAYGGVLLLALIMSIQVGIALVFNTWNEWFFDTVDHATERTESELWLLVAMFVLIALSDVLIYTIGDYLKRVYTLWWREALTHSYIPRWLKTTHNVEGASQRLEQDVREFAELVRDLGVDFIRSVFTLGAFIPILWVMSAYFKEGWLAWDGSLVVVVVTCTALGMLISWLVGIYLPVLENQNQKVEAALRKQLVYAEDDRAVLSKGQWKSTFAEVVNNYHVLFRHYGYFDGWRLGYIKFMMLVPYVICVPHMPSGVITLAIMMKLVHAFGEVQGGFSVILRDWPKVTRLRSVYWRLKEFEKALCQPVTTAEVIEVPGSPGSLSATTATVIKIRELRRQK